MNRFTRDERGAVAVIFGLTAALLLTLCALGVDLGQAWAQKRQIQSSSDSATLAGAGIAGNDLPAPSAGKVCGYGTGATSNDPAAQDVARYVASKAYSPVIAPAAVNSGVTNAMAQQLTDCNVGNGEVFYGMPKFNKTTKAWTLVYNKNQLSLVSPPSNVDFGFAGVLGINDVDVVGVSTVEIQSPKMATLPFYAFSGCDYGPQTLQQPNNGQSAAAVLLASPTNPSPANTNTTLITSINPISYPVDPNNQFTEPLVLNMTNVNGTITDVGFFESGNATTGPAPVTTTSFTVNAAKTQLTIADLPAQTRGVSGVQEFWYVRVKIGGQWSAVYVGNGNNQTLNAPVLTIGDPPLVCSQGSSSGNFGTILLSHAGYNGWDSIGAANVAIGLDSTLSIYPVASRQPDGTCSSAQPATILWTGAGTNCVDTDTGMSANVATGGFLGLGSSAPGGNQYLLKPNGKTKCANGGTTEATTVLKGQTINNDTLSCFFINSTTHVADVDDNTYTLTGPAISDKIYSSPRFGYVPVLPVQPANGGSKKYQIIDFRACFITDQPGSAVKGDAPSSTNGVITDTNGVHSVEVIFLNPSALPNPPVVNGTINYTGSGPKIPVLVN